MRSRANERAGFTLMELMVAVTVFAIIMTLLMSLTSIVLDTWSDSESHIQTEQGSRGVLELIGREVGPAVVDTQMQFVVAPGSVLSEAGAPNVAPNSQAALWMAPLGEDGELRCVGYYLSRDTANGFYRLKRIYIEPDNPFFPNMENPSNPRDAALEIDPVSAKWFTRNWTVQSFDEADPDNDHVIVSTVADRVVAFWLQPIDLLGNPFPWLSESTIHPTSQLHFNSAAFFQVATTTPFDDGRSVVFLADGDKVMRAHRVPAAMDVTIVVVDEVTIRRKFQIPEQTFEMDGDALDVARSIDVFNETLLQNKIKTAKTFTTRVKLLNGS